MILLSVVLALALTAALAACGSDQPSGVTGPDRTASTPTETPASPAQTPTTTVSGDAPTATDTPGPATATSPPAASGSAETDREALVALYNAMDGDNWWFGDSDDNWLSDAPLGEWRSVFTNDDGRVIELYLTEIGLSGELPPELASLSNLTHLGLSDNELSEIPAWLGSLSNLTHLGLSGNKFSGEIPAELGSLSNLVTLDLSDNDLSGEIPPELGIYADLNWLHLDGNDLSGCVPRDPVYLHSSSRLGGLPFC